MNDEHAYNEMWDDTGIPTVLERLFKIGWIEFANFRRADCKIIFTKAGREGLKPLADFKIKTGGFNDKECFAVFEIAMKSQEIILE